MPHVVISIDLSGVALLAMIRNAAQVGYAPKGHEANVDIAIMPSCQPL